MKAASPLLGLIIVCSFLSCRDKTSAPAGGSKTRDRAGSDPVRLQSAALQKPGFWKYHFTAVEEKEIAQSGDLQALLHYYLDPYDGSERTIDHQTLLAGWMRKSSASSF